MSIIDFRKKIHAALVTASGESYDATVNLIQDALIPRRTADFKMDRVEQVAMYVSDMDRAKANYARLGLTNWVDDTVTGEVKVAYGGNCKNGINIAHLSFNYDLGFELELIRYMNGPNWHHANGRIGASGEPYDALPFPSHMSWHVEDMTESKSMILAAGFKIAQEVKTIAHTNPYLVANGRKFNYCVFDTRAQLGWDIKLIERIEATK